mgnify:CR=1 FL=1
MMKRRVCILLMDSFGIGASLDASLYGDEAANTFAHIFQARADENSHCSPLYIPHLTELGLFHAAMGSSGETLVDLSMLPPPKGLYGYAVEKSRGKDTPSGHWELAGVPVEFDWGYFPKKIKCFPLSFIQAFIQQTKIPGVLGEKHASGTEIIKELGKEHIETSKPIVYTSADSVFQVAAHEEYFGLDRLYHICEIARTLLDSYNIGRVIARPFTGEPGNFKRTAHRKDYAVLPPAPTLLDKLVSAGRSVISIGKVADIFAHQGITEKIYADDNQGLFEATVEALKTAPDGSLIFTNFVDFDSLYGHRRDVLGYADALEKFDSWLPSLQNILRKDDLVIIAADHGCDPTFPGSDHTREHIPVLGFGPQIKSQYIGRRDSFADVGQTIAEYLDISPLLHGVSFL